MNKITFIVVAVSFTSILFMNSTKVNAQMVGADEENWNKVFMELKGLNSRLIFLEKSVEEIKHALPQDSIGDVIDQINAQNKRLEDTNLLFRSELIPTIHKEITANNLRADLANEKLSRLIEILKTIAKEQVKLDPVVTTLGAVQKSQADLKKNQKEIKKALADLRRKANVNIFRNDEIRKALRQFKK